MYLLKLKKTSRKKEATRQLALNNNVVVKLSKKQKYYLNKMHLTGVKTPTVNMDVLMGVWEARFHTREVVVFS